MKRVFILLLPFIVIVSTSELSSNWMICEANDPQCLNAGTESAIKFLANGSEELELQQLEPFAMGNMFIDGINLNQNYENVKIHGLTEGLVISNFKVNLNTPVFEFTSFNPQVSFIADYRLDGYFFFQSINGEGKSNITLSKLKSTNTFYGKIVMKNGEEYMKIEMCSVKVNPEDVDLHFNNLFRGSKEKIERMDEFLRHNSRALFSELRDPYEKKFAQVFGQIANSIFDKIPLSKLVKLN